MESSKIILITGGARSGKSSFALELAEQVSEKKLFVATCPQIDPEMQARIDRHKEERKGRGWDTVECPLDLVGTINDSRDRYEVLLIDCLTLWVNNVLYFNDQKGMTTTDDAIRSLCLDWLMEINNTSATVILVTNEVGLGIVPDNAQAREYRDLVGTVNQCVGKRADEVVLVTCGVPHYLKK